MNWEQVAEKIVPWSIIALIGASITMYMNVEGLMVIAKNSIAKSEKQYAKYDIAIRECEKNDIIQNKEIEFLKVGFQ